MATDSNRVRALIEKLDQLPPERVAKVEDFVDFPTTKTRDKAYEDAPATAEEVAKAGVAILTSEEIEAEIKAYRDERRRALSSFLIP